MTLDENISTCLSDRLIQDNFHVVRLSPDEMLQKNRELLQHDYLTDVITCVMGEDLPRQIVVFICPEVIQANAQALNIQYALEEKRVLIHAHLHTLGFADRTKNQKNLMRLLENELMSCSTWKQSLTLL